MSATNVEIKSHAISGTVPTYLAVGASAGARAKYTGVPAAFASSGGVVQQGTRKTPFPGPSSERATGLEPATLSLEG